MTMPGKIEGLYFLPLSSESQPAFLLLVGHEALITDQAGRTLCRQTIERLHGDDTLYLSNDGQFRANQALPSEWLETRRSRATNALSWFEHFSWPKMVLLCILLIASVVTIRVAIRGSAHLVTQYFPTSWERQIGQAYYSGFKEVAFAPSQLDDMTKERLTREAEKLSDLSGLDPKPELFFHSARSLGPNALAFPGGPIVVTDQLVTLLDSDDQTLGVIAHELGHIQERHSLHQTIDLLGMALLVSFVFGTDDSLMEEVTALGINGLAFSNSREFEREADRAAINILIEAGRNPEAFVAAMEKLTRYQCRTTDGNKMQDCITDTGSSWMSTHPSGAERITNLREQIKESTN